MKVGWAVSLIGTIIVATGCATRPETPTSRNELSNKVNRAVAQFRATDPSIEEYFETAYAYAVLPEVTKGAVMVGGAFGRGEVFARGTKVGYCSMTQASLGFSFGGQYFREVIFFEDKEAFDLFSMGQFTMSAQVTAVVLKSGSADRAAYNFGLAVFVAADKGLMVDASVGGQQFEYEPAFVIRYEPLAPLPPSR